MNKRGQITVFIIIGLIILASGLTYYVIRQRSATAKLEAQVEQQQTFEGNVEALESYVSNCIESTAQNGLTILGLQSGWLFRPENVPEPIAFGNYSIYHDQYLNDSWLPTEESVEFQLSAYISQFLNDCVDFTQFPELRIGNATINTTTDIIENHILITSIIPLKVSQGQKTKQFDKFSVKIPVRLKGMLSTADEIIRFGIENPGYFDSECVALSEFNNVLIPYSNTTHIVVMSDKESLIYNDPYVFMFAMKYAEVTE